MVVVVAHSGGECSPTFSQYHGGAPGHLKTSVTISSNGIPIFLSH